MGIALVLLAVAFAIRVGRCARHRAPKALAKIEDEHEYQWDEYVACVARQQSLHN